MITTDLFQDLIPTTITLGLCNILLVIENLLQNYEPKKKV